ncbi:right-handed parallel beta-helix repeat-containing protein [Paraglaciecola polaris]|uniref:Right handed beta helix domain-containing protein n=1 Tax=Paraglaciecola polaris LMG 21857 TaxID=1129793 RepID=K7A0T9_9ALTE|nr:right-handed parallel beta-helix repeat-containing protein [Paraglaciecola polaris]GAC34583.1 hypothetical protein GPLA_3698 [Paraglaciecola polaris LMG 21857]
MNKNLIIAVSCFVIALSMFNANATTVIRLSPSADDMTPVLVKALQGTTDKDIKIIFEKGEYRFLADYAMERYTTVTNHDNGLKKVIFALDGYNSVEIEGNGANFIFHGRVAPFQVFNSQNITIKNLSIDWDIPFTFLAEIMAVNEKEGWRDVKPRNGSHQWALKNGKITFPNVDGFTFTELGSSLPWEADIKRVSLGAIDLKSRPTHVEKLDNGLLRIYEKLDSYPPVGSLFSSKGDRNVHRYAPAFHMKNAKNVEMSNVVVHHALGMGFLFERTEDIALRKVGVYLSEGSDRVISTIADATHFANCKGHVLIEDSRFENMLDDGTNLRGTYVMVDEVINDKTLRFKFGHFEQLGYEFAAPGDEVWLIQQPNTERQQVNIISKVNVINEEYSELTFEQTLPKNLQKGDLIENKTWYPSFTMRGTTIKNNRARNVVIKTPLKTVIEDNYFSSMMASILFRGESYFWFEAGAVGDVLIQNNHFEYNSYYGGEQAVLYITPRLGKVFNQKQLYDQNIRFINNKIDTHGGRIVWADRVDGIVVENNSIERSIHRAQLFPDAPVFEFKNSQNVTLKNNRYIGDYNVAVVVDKTSGETLKDDGSIK